MTNFERIKQMTVEEMAVFLGNKPYCELELGECDCVYGWHDCNCEEHAKKWLKSEVYNNACTRNFIQR